jgi:GAF domain-containing protein
VFEENLWVFYGSGEEDITKADLPIMSIFAKQIGISLERARFFRRCKALP